MFRTHTWRGGRHVVDVNYQSGGKSRGVFNQNVSGLSTWDGVAPFVVVALLVAGYGNPFVVLIALLAFCHVACLDVLCCGLLPFMNGSDMGSR
jgi:hypothetical protein